jgi:hypothetical protein
MARSMAAASQDPLGQSKAKTKGINLLDTFAVKRQLDEVATEVRDSLLTS